MTAEPVRPGEFPWADRVKLFLETRNYDHITLDDLDKLHEHWSMCWRLHQIKDGQADG